MVFVVSDRGGSDVTKIIQLSMLMFAPVIMFLVTSISIILIHLIGKKFFYFSPYTTKIVIIKYMIEGGLYYLFSLSKSFPLLII